MSCYTENYLIALSQMNVVEKYLDHLNTHHKGELGVGTTELYDKILSQLLDFLAKRLAEKQGVKPRWINCDEEILADYFHQLESQGRPPARIAKKKAVINSFFDFLVKHHYTAEGRRLKKNPMKKLTEDYISSRSPTRRIPRVGEPRLPVPRTRDICYKCKGTGELVCAACDGQGRIPGKSMTGTITCRECDGQTMVKCPVCSGIGYHKEEKKP